MLNGKVILVTGGTGSFGQRFAHIVLGRYKPRKLIIFSRDEQKQFEMRRTFPPERFSNVRFFIGDVRDKDRLRRAFDGVDIVVHAAALKHVPTCEYDPIEAVKTNILGAANVVEAALDCNVHRVIALSTDKAANPINLYGATKLCSDKLFVAGNSYSGAHPTRFSVVRYGNVVGSRGSVIPHFMSMRTRGVVPITDPRMTRFMITLDDAVEFVISSLERMDGGEVFVPKLPSINIMDLAKAVAPDCKTEIVGIRPGEKLHEVMIPEDASRHTLEYGGHFAVMPSHESWTRKKRDGGRMCPEKFVYSSDRNDHWLTVEELRRIVGSLVVNQRGIGEEQFLPI